MRLAPLLALVLAGCAWSSPTTVARLSGLSPTEVDPAALSVGLTLPEGVAVRPGSARLFLGAVRGEESVGRRAALVSEGDRWRIDPDAVEPLRETQAVIRRWKAEDPRGTKGTLSVALEGCETGDGPPAEAAVSIDLALSPGGPPLPLLRDAPLSAVTGRAPLEPCEGPTR